MSDDLLKPAADVEAPHASARGWLGPFMVLAGGISIGFAPIGLRLGLDALGPQAIAFWRYVFAAPLLLGLVFLVEGRAPGKPNIFIVLAGTFFALDIALWHRALAITTVANATFIVNLGNISVGLAAWVFLKERPAKVWFLAILLAGCGAAALSLGGGEAGKGVLRGDLLALGAAMLVSFYMLCSKIARRSLGGVETIFWLTCVEICVAFFVVLISGEAFLPQNIAGFTVPFLLAIIVQIAGQGLIITGLGRTPAAMAGVLIVIQPVIAASVAWSLFKEPMNALQAAGGGLILIGIWLAGKGAVKKS